MIIANFFSQFILAQNCGNKWIMGYLPTYQQDADGGVSFMSNTDFQRITHLIHLGPYVKSDGSLDMNINTSDSNRLVGAVNAAHSHGIPIILSISSWVTAYLPAIQNVSSRNMLLNSILNLVDTYQYDGVDLDLEPIMSPYIAGLQSNNPDFINFASMLYDSLQTRYSTFLQHRPLYTIAANGYAAPVLAQLQNKFTMINIMTYDLAGVYPGWVTWHDSPIYSGGNIMPSTGNPLPSVNGEMQLCLAQGIPNSKLSIGISFDAFRWQGGTGTNTGGVTAPMQSYTSNPSWTRFPYNEFYQNYYNANFYHYDSTAKMSYLSIDNAGSANDEFWSYNDKTSIEDKMQYVWDNNFGGVIVWELKSGYIPSLPAGSQIPQLGYIQAKNCGIYNARCRVCGTFTIIK